MFELRIQIYHFLHHSRTKHKLNIKLMRESWKGLTCLIKWDRIKIDLYNFIHISRYYLNLTTEHQPLDEEKYAFFNLVYKIGICS